MECPYCHLSIKTIPACRRHILGTHPDKPSYLCECGQVFEFKKGLRHHQLKCPSYKANICQPTQSKYVNTIFPYTCELCQAHFKNKSHLRYHVNVEHPLKLIKEI